MNEVYNQKYLEMKTNARNIHKWASSKKNINNKFVFDMGQYGAEVHACELLDMLTPADLGTVKRPTRHLDRRRKK